MGASDFLLALGGCLPRSSAKGLTVHPKLSALTHRTLPTFCTLPAYPRGCGTCLAAFKPSFRIPCKVYSRSKLDKSGALLVTADWKAQVPGTKFYTPALPPSCWHPCQRSRTQAALHQGCQIPDSVNGLRGLQKGEQPAFSRRKGTKPTWAPRLSSCWNACRAVAFAQKGFEKGTARIHFLFMRCSH